MILISGNQMWQRNMNDQDFTPLASNGSTVWFPDFFTFWHSYHINQCIFERLSLLTGTKLKSLKFVSNVEGNLIIKENWKGKFYRCMKEKRCPDDLFAKLALLKLVNWRGILDHKFVEYHVQEMRELIQVKSLNKNASGVKSS